MSDEEKYKWETIHDSRVRCMATLEKVNHPSHYGGENNPYEAIKVIDSWGLSFTLGNVVKYISRAGRKGSYLEDLKKARWYLDHEISKTEKPRNDDFKED